jgi:transposase InsO family protein
MAAAVRGGRTAGTILHWDRGVSTSPAKIRWLIDERGMRQSVDCTGVGWDNSVAEPACSSLIGALIHRYTFADRTTARRAIFAWINSYDTRRRHTSRGHIPPIESENEYPWARGQPGRVIYVTGQRGTPRPSDSPGGSRVNVCG